MDQAAVWRSWQEAHLRISRFVGNEANVVVVKPPPFPLVDQLPNGNWVVVGARADAQDRNGFIFCPDGSLKADFHAGDAVMNMSVSDDASLWLGYFDEGVFGDDPLSQHGLVRVDAQGRPTWRYPNEDIQSGFIGDCYALTTCGKEAWACPYMDFPILQIAEGRVRRWANAIGGAEAICAAADHVILAGGYADDYNLMSLLRLTGDETSLVAQARLNGMTRATGRFQGRGGSMFAFTGQDVAEVVIADWLSVC